MKKLIGTFYGVAITFSHESIGAIDLAEEQFKKVMEISSPSSKTDKEINKEVEDFMASCKNN